MTRAEFEVGFDRFVRGERVRRQGTTVTVELPMLATLEDS
jgi:hypothetical protein